MLTSYGDETKILDALNAGAHGYLLKHSDPDDVIEGVRVAYAGDAPLDPRAVGADRAAPARSQADRPDPAGARGARPGRAGMADEEIAPALEITERTVKARLAGCLPAHRRDR